MLLKLSVERKKSVFVKYCNIYFAGFVGGFLKRFVRQSPKFLMSTFAHACDNAGIRSKLVSGAKLGFGVR